jgi:hypothetical protein
VHCCVRVATLPNSGGSLLSYQRQPPNLLPFSGVTSLAVWQGSLLARSAPATQSTPFQCYDGMYRINQYESGHPRGILLDQCCDRLQGWWQDSWYESGHPRGILLVTRFKRSKGENPNITPSSATPQPLNAVTALMITLLMTSHTIGDPNITP